MPESLGARFSTVCLIFGENFLVWGGTVGTETFDEPSLVFIMSRKNRVTEYTPSDSMKGIMKNADLGSRVGSSGN